MRHLHLNIQNMCVADHITKLDNLAFSKNIISVLYKIYLTSLHGRR